MSLKLIFVILLLCTISHSLLMIFDFWFDLAIVKLVLHWIIWVCCEVHFELHTAISWQLLCFSRNWWSDRMSGFDQLLSWLSTSSMTLTDSAIFRQLSRVSSRNRSFLSRKCRWSSFSWGHRIVRPPAWTSLNLNYGIITCGSSLFSKR